MSLVWYVESSQLYSNHLLWCQNYVLAQRWADASGMTSIMGQLIQTMVATESLNKALKYSRKKNMTLTGMVKLLTEQFLPDIHQHYLFENYRQLPFYRAASDTVPDYLRGRPHAVIKHCLVHKTNSNKFTAEAVQMTEKPGVFHVVKASGGKHIVDFGAGSREGKSRCTWRGHSSSYSRLGGVSHQWHLQLSFGCGL